MYGDSRNGRTTRFDAVYYPVKTILFDQYVEAYGPYMKDRRVFENSKTEAILGKRNIACPDFDYGIFSKCMQYAVDVDWGTKLFDRAK